MYIERNQTTLDLVFGGQELSIDIGENTAAAALSASRAVAAESASALNADRAENAALAEGYYPTIAAGTAATTAPDTFLSDEAGNLGIYDAGGTLLHTYVATAGLVQLNQDADVTLTVGTTGTYSTLNAALEAASRYRTVYKAGGVKVDINILDDGWIMAEQVIATGVDLRDIRIVSDQAAVTIDRASLTQLAALPDFQGVTVKASAFMGSNGAFLPRIACNFTMNTTGTAADQGGILFMKGATCVVEPTFGFNDCDGLGAHVVYGSRLLASESVWTGNGVGGDPYFAGGVRGDWLATLVLAEASVDNNVGQGVMANGGTVLTLRDGSATGNGDDGVQGGTGSILHLRGAAINTNSGVGVYAGEACVVRLIDTQVNNNTGNGLFVDGGAKVSAVNGTEINNNGAFGVRCTQMGKVVCSNIDVNNNGSGGLFADGGDIYFSGSEASGNPAGKDMQVGTGARIQLSGVITTSSGTSVDNNVADSNVSAFNLWRSGGGGGIFGRGGRAENRGDGDIASGATSVTVTHGVDFSPNIDEVTLTAQESLGSATQFWVSNMTETTFNINVDQAPGKQLTIGWTIQRMIG